MVCLDAANPGSPRRFARWLYIALPSSIAAGLALGLLLRPSPAPSSVGSSVALIPLDPAPIISPAARLVSGIDQPLRDEASALARDTRRATQMVVDCLRVASRGG
jgi:hypothetical protein